MLFVIFRSGTFPVILCFPMHSNQPGETPTTHLQRQRLAGDLHSNVVDVPQRAFPATARSHSARRFGRLSVRSLYYGGRARVPKGLRPRGASLSAQRTGREYSASAAQLRPDVVGGRGDALHCIRTAGLVGGWQIALVGVVVLRTREVCVLYSSI